MADGADKTDTADSPGQPVNTGRAVHALGLHRRKRPQRLKQFHDFLGADVFTFVPKGRSPNGHELDETNLQRLRKGQPGKIDEFVIVYPFQGNDIQFDRVKAKLPGLVDPGPDLGKGVNPGNLLETLRNQGVKADIQLADSGVPQGLGMVGQQNTVGGKADVV